MHCSRQHLLSNMHTAHQQAHNNLESGTQLLRFCVQVSTGMMASKPGLALWLDVMAVLKERAKWEDIYNGADVEFEEPDNREEHKFLVTPEERQLRASSIWQTGPLMLTEALRRNVEPPTFPDMVGSPFCMDCQNMKMPHSLHANVLSILLCCILGNFEHLLLPSPDQYVSPLSYCLSGFSYCITVHGIIMPVHPYP